MCFCLYSRTFIVVRLRVPPQNSSQIYVYAEYEVYIAWA